LFGVNLCDDTCIGVIYCAQNYAAGFVNHRKEISSR
jgi:hypothetical protein